VVEEAPDDVGTAREHLNLLFDVAEPSAQLGRIVTTVQGKF